MDLLGTGFNYAFSDKFTVGFYLTTFDLTYRKGNKIDGSAYFVPKIDLNINDRYSLTVESWLYTYQTRAWNSNVMLTFGMLLRPENQSPSALLASGGVRTLAYETLARRNSEESVDYKILYGYEYDRALHTGYLTIPFLNLLEVNTSKLRLYGVQYGAWGKFLIPTRTGAFEVHIQSKAQLRYGVASWSNFDFGVEWESVGFDARLFPNSSVKLATDQLAGIVIRFLFYDITLQPVRYSVTQKKLSISPMGIRVAVESPF